MALTQVPADNLLTCRSIAAQRVSTTVLSGSARLLKIRKGACRLFNSRFSANSSHSPVKSAALILHLITTQHVHTEASADLTRPASTKMPAPESPKKLPPMEAIGVKDVVNQQPVRPGPSQLAFVRGCCQVSKRAAQKEDILSSRG